jgi:hypothetical protein
MRKKLRVLIINSEDRTITEGEISSLQDAQAIVGGYIERATTFANGDELYVNEEGLLNSPQFFFNILGGHQPFAGNAYIIGAVDGEGENLGAVTKVDEAKYWVQFITRTDVEQMLLGRRK